MLFCLALYRYMPAGQRKPLFWTGRVWHDVDLNSHANGIVDPLYFTDFAAAARAAATLGAGLLMPGDCIAIECSCDDD